MVSLKRVLHCLWLPEQHCFSQLSRYFLKTIVESHLEITDWAMLLMFLGRPKNIKSIAQSVISR